MRIRLENISKNYENQVVLEPLDALFTQGKTTVLLGSSGCGKSTLLRIIDGLIQPNQGKIFYNDKEFHEYHPSELRQQIGYVIQDGGLFPHLTALDNILLQARYFKKPKQEMIERLHELEELVQIPKYLLSHYPKELSGGQKQRISMMRALMLDPQCILLDEPLSALDPITRHELQQQLKHIFSQLNKTVIMVTHDMQEAAYLADEIMMMHKGKILQKGTYKQLLENPANSFVKDFIKFQEMPE